MAKDKMALEIDNWDELPTVSYHTLQDIFTRKFTHYLFYKKYSGRIEWACSNCGAHSVEYAHGMYNAGLYYEFKDTLSDGKTVTCPRCHEICDAKPVGRSRTKLRKRRAYAILMHDGDMLYINVHSFYVTYGEAGDFCEEARSAWLDYRYVLNMAEHKTAGACYSDYYGWHSYDNLTEPYLSYWGSSLAADIYNREELIGTPLGYCPPVQNYHPVKFLQLLCRYPNIERLAKFKLSGVLGEIIDYREPFKRAINFEGKTPWAMLRLTKQEYESFIGQKGNAGAIFLEDIKRYRAVKALDTTVNMQDALTFIRLDRGFVYKCGSAISRGALKYVTIHKFLKYLDKQRMPLGCMAAMGHIETMHQSYQNYGDYINDCKALKYDLNDRQIVLPPSLFAAHQRTIAAKEALRIEEVIKQREQTIKGCDKYIDDYKARSKQLQKWYGFEDDTYFIRIPTGAREIVEEGALMHHCVGGYAKRHMEGTTTILFMRKKSDPDTPLYTIEVNDKPFRLIQIRADHNGPVAPGADMAFYKAFVAEMQKRDKNRSGKSKKQKAAKTA